MRKKEELLEKVRSSIHEYLQSEFEEYRNSDTMQMAFDRAMAFWPDDYMGVLRIWHKRYLNERKMYEANVKICKKYALPEPADTVCRGANWDRLTEKDLMRTISRLLSKTTAGLHIMSKDITDILFSVGYDEYDTDCILYRADKAAEIYRDVAGSLTKYHYGRDIADMIRLSGLNADDLSVLATLHKEKKCTQKIETLLSELGLNLVVWDFIDKKYDKYIKEEEKNE